MRIFAHIFGILGSILRFMRHRRARRRAIEEPATSQAGTQTEQNTASRIPVLTRGMSTRNTTRSDASGENNASSSRASQRVDTPVSVILGDSLMRLQEQRRRNLETRPPIRRPQVNGSSDLNDIHRVARSRTFSDLLDNPFGPASHYDPMSFDDIVDLTEDLNDLTRDDSSSSSGTSSSSNDTGSDSEFTLRSSPPSVSGRSNSSLSLDIESESELLEE